MGFQMRVQILAHTLVPGINVVLCFQNLQFSKMMLTQDWLREKKIYQKNF